MTTELKKFLVADQDGFALYVGDAVYSNFHKKVIELSGIFIDCDDEVFLTCDDGTVRIRNIRRLTPKDIKEILAGIREEQNTTSTI
jgi:hypothetical protein